MCRFSKKYSNIKFSENPSCGSRAVPCGRTDLTELIVAFRNFANVPKTKQCKEGCSGELDRIIGRRTKISIARAECDDTSAETRFRLSPKRTSPFKSLGVSVQSTAGSRGVGISLSNVG